MRNQSQEARVPQSSTVRPCLRKAARDAAKATQVAATQGDARTASRVALTASAL